MDKYITAKKILKKFLVSLVVFTVMAVLLLVVGWWLCDRVIWRKTDTWYPFIHFVHQHYSQCLFGTLALGYLVLAAISVFRCIYLVSLIMEASRNLYREQEETVAFPSEWAEVEKQFIQIKYDMQHSRQAAREAEQKKNDLIMYLAHDLKTPLTSVIGYLVLLEEEGEISKELQEKYIKIAREKAERLEELINEFFDITRFNLTTIELEVSDVNLTRLLEQLTYEWKPELKEKNLEIVCRLEKDIHCNADADKLMRVFDNLLKNAVNYSIADTAITVAARRLGENRIQVVFENEGKTLPPKKLERMFQQFYRGDTSRSSKSGGAGLGLAIAREIVELHGGSLRAESEEGKIRFLLELSL